MNKEKFVSECEQLENSRVRALIREITNVLPPREAHQFYDACFASALIAPDEKVKDVVCRCIADEVKALEKKILRLEDGTLVRKEIGIISPD